MADFVWSKRANTVTDERLQRLYDEELRPIDGLTIHRNPNTTSSMVLDGNSVFVLGHCFYPGKTTRETLEDLLNVTTETDVAEMKSKLFGHYIVVIKTGDLFVIFSDYLSMRAIFYEVDGVAVSSSLNAVERLIGASAGDLDGQRVYELCAIQGVAYPGVLGGATLHKNIKRLRPYEFIRIDQQANTFEVRSCTFEIDNRKERDVEVLARALIANLEQAIRQPDLRTAQVGSTITGGYDSRLVSTLVSRHYDNPRLRICVSGNNRRSQYDLGVGRKLATRLGLPLDEYETRTDAEVDDYHDLTEGCTPSENAVMANLIRGTGKYDVAFDGTLGTELFMPVNFDTIDRYIEFVTERARTTFVNGEVHLPLFIEHLRTEFSNLQAHYAFAEDAPQDLLRLFSLHNTTSCFSAVRSAYNILGMQMEPYFAPSVIETAFQVPSDMWGRKHAFAGTAHVQKKAMELVNPGLGSVMSFSHFDPMLPLSARTLPAYLIGYIKHLAFGASEKLERRAASTHLLALGGFQYKSNGWNQFYVRRIRENYGVDLTCHD